MVKSDSRSLLRKDDICSFLGIGKDRFYRLVKEGLPVQKKAGNWTGNKDEIDDFFKKYPTLIRPNNN